MTPEDQIKAIAELDGWTDVKFYVLGHKPDGITALARSRSADYRCDLPDYLTSYDAIIPLIQKQTPQVKWHIWDTLSNLIGGGIWESLIEATPSQLLDALLVATGKATI